MTTADGRERDHSEDRLSTGRLDLTVLRKVGLKCTSTLKVELLIKD